MNGGQVEACLTNENPQNAMIIAGMLATLGTGYVVTKFSYSPVFLVAGLMHPAAMAIIAVMLPSCVADLPRKYP